MFITVMSTVNYVSGYLATFILNNKQQKQSYATKYTTLKFRSIIKCIIKNNKNKILNTIKTL